MATWLDFCTRRPGPSWKQGYGGIITSRPLTIIEGEVKHITLGPMTAALGVLDGPRQVSWPFTIPRVGRPLQHYPLEAVCWHAGLIGDADLDTELVGNVSLLGEEHEGVDGDTPTDSQFHWTTEISREVRRLCPLVAAYPPELAVNLWEHNWLVATSCPNRLWSHSRNNWDWLIAALTNVVEEDDMKLRFIQKSGSAVYVTDGLSKWGVPSPAVRSELVSSGLVESNSLTQVSAALFGLIKTTHGQPTAGGGLTQEETVEAVKEANREGTG